MDASSDDFSSIFWSHALTPQNVGFLSNPDGYAKAGRECGDYLELCLRLAGDKITEARFFTEGCMQMVACGSGLTSLLIGRNITEAWNITAQDVANEVGGLPPKDEHCAQTAEEALRLALADLNRTQQNPWQKLYRKQ